MKIASWLAYQLPKSVIYFAVIRAWAYATTGEWSKESPLEVTAETVLRRWDTK